MLLLDASASMHGPRSEFDWNFAINIAEDVVTRMPSTSEIGLEFFSTKLVRVASPTNERQKLKNELHALRTDYKTLVPIPGETALWDAIIDSFNMFESPHLGDAIYVITDGGDNASNIAMKKVTRTLGEAGVRLFGFVFQRSSTATSPEEILGPEYVQQVVDATGGTILAYEPRYFDSIPIPGDVALFGKSGRPTELGSLLGSQYRQMFSFYRVDIDLPQTVDKPREWKLELARLDKSQRDDLVLKYPHMLAPCH